MNRYIPFAFIYFFVNSVALPFGLTYTALLAPVFYAWILLKRKKDVILPFLLLIFPFIIIHVTIVEVDEPVYFVSLLNLLLVYIFCQAVYTFLLYCQDVEKVLKWILIVNFILCLVAIPVYFTESFGLLWDEQVVKGGVGSMRRLKLFTYEPSYYALLFTPVFLFFLLQFLFRQNKIPSALLLIMLFLPYVLSFSIGVIAALVISGLITWVIYFFKLTRKRRVLNSLVYTGVSLASLVVVSVLFFRHNQVFLRVTNIFKGRDTSGRGRTNEAFILARKMLDEKNDVWGIGLGQIKLVGNNIIRNYYLYMQEITVTIPNVTAETWTVFGAAGLFIRFGLEIFLFFYTRVWTNYYRLLLFFFMFIYQFTGSFITNIAEYVIWILAFTNVFAQFDVGKDNRRIRLS
jgi:hypothetical protein